MSTFLTM